MPNKVYRAVETAITFRDSGGDKTLALNGLAFGTYKTSDQQDNGTGSKSQLYEVKAVIQWAASPVLGEAAEIWLHFSDGTYVDGTIGTTAATPSGNKRKNALFVGAVICDVASGATDMVASFQNVPISERYYSVAVYNASAATALQATANASRIIVTPMPPELQ